MVRGVLKEVEGCRAAGGVLGGEVGQGAGERGGLSGEGEAGAGFLSGDEGVE